jgi:hypothetical protein
VDLIIHLQSAAKITQDLWQNIDYLRIHKQTDNLHRIKDRVSNYPQLFIADAIVTRRYMDGNERNFIYVDMGHGKISGATREEFANGCRSYLNTHKSVLSQFISGTDQNARSLYRKSDQNKAVNDWIKNQEKDWLDTEMLDSLERNAKASLGHSSRQKSSAGSCD